MKTILPPRALALLKNWQARLLLLAVIWGVGSFLWGTLHAWSQHQALQQGRHFVQEQMALTNAWLGEALGPVEKLAGDERLRSAITLPDGVASVPVLRVLYEFAYLHHASDLYVVDLASDKVGATAGSPRLNPEVLARLKDLNGQNGMLIGAGARNGAIFVVRSVPAPLPHRVVVVVPFSLARLADGRPVQAGESHDRLGLLLPHTAGWAWWDQDATSFELLPKDTMEHMLARDAVKTDDGVVIMQPLDWLGNVWLGVKKPALLDTVAWLPQMLLGAWVLALTGLVLWRPSRQVRGTVQRALAPMRVPARLLAGALAVPFAAFSNYMREQVSDLDGPPLVDGPGDFMPSDFKGMRGWQKLWHGGKPEAPASPTRQSARRVPVEAPTLSPEQQAKNAADLQRDKEERELKDVIRACLREGRLALLYQPIYRVADGVPAMHEVYARLVKPGGEVLMPGQFLPVTNRFGLTQALDAAVFRKVLATHFENGTPPAGKLALNVGGTSLDGIAYLQELLGHGAHVLENLVFEVRSQEIVRDPKALKLLKDIQKHGGHLAVDYFGGGKAMLQASAAMGFGYVKLDASRFVGETGQAELAGLCAAAEEGGLPMVLEKVEDQATMEFARSHGVTYLQGYALAKPLPELVSAPLVATPPAANTAQVDTRSADPSLTPGAES
ncbi:MAG: EAL domain-containing protein [Proteobacteria bacterium]|nr:EAL domain-containing protein [Pseudomonadota bacterium]